MDIKKIVHVGKVNLSLNRQFYLYLIEENGLFQWQNSEEESPNISSETQAIAINKAFKSFSPGSFQLLNCGFRYTLPERDEVGSRALFKHMVDSYNSPNGVYFDSELGHMAKVDFASQEALKLWKRHK